MADADVNMCDNSMLSSIEVTSIQPHSSKTALLEDNKPMETDPNLSEKNVPDTPAKSKIENEKASVDNSTEVDDAVDQALNLVLKLRETIKLIPNSRIKSRTKRQANILHTSSPSASGDASNELQHINTENKRLQQDLQNKHKTIIELSSKYEEANEQLQEKSHECAQLQASIQSFSTCGESFPSSSSDVSASTDEQSYPPQSLPIFSNSARVPDVEMQRKIREMENKMKNYRPILKQLTDMNAQWGQYNAEKENVVKLLEENVREQQQEIEYLEMSGSGNASSQVLTFSPAQQAFIDDAYQRIRSEADRYRDQQEATALDAQRKIADSRRRREVAENAAGTLHMRVVELENEVRTLGVQQEELQTALLVATRSSQQSSQEQELISSLREATRQYEEDLQRTTEDQRKILRENAALRDQLAGQRSANTFQRLVTRNPDGSTTVMTTNRPSNVMSGDLEFD